jgi:hypothetical protein
MTELAGALLEGVVDRLTRPDYRAFDAQLRSSGYCARPVRLRGLVEVCDGHGGRRQVWSTDSEPDELLRKACGNRREAICGPCAERYRGDAWQLIAAGLRGGKGVPESVVGHPAVFATLTAPSFGAVHVHLLDGDGRPQRCRPRRDAPICPHGIRLACSARHAPDDPCLGEPLCAACFDYEGAVVWNNLLGELWRRTTIYLPRQLAALLGITQKRCRELVRVSYVKVAEYQRRGLVHLHLLIRLDRRMAAYRADEVRPPERRFTLAVLEDALRGAAAAVSVQAPDELGGGTVQWGSQLDVQRPPRRDTRDRRLAACAHAFGYRGHCLTKSRRWSTTFKKLRQAREDHVREQLLAGSDRKQRELAQLADDERITAFEFVGVGHLTTADAFLAAQAAARARENRELAREALCDQRQRRSEHGWGATPQEAVDLEGLQP